MQTLKQDKAEFFHPVDEAFGISLVDPSSQQSEEQAFFLAYLLKAARDGHLCVRIGVQEIEPELEDFNNVPRGKEKLIKGAKEYSGDAVVKYGDLYYLQRNWAKETVCLEEFQRLISSHPEFLPDVSQINVENLQPEQTLAIRTCLQNSLSILNGGPGTGKTYTAGRILKTLWETLTHEQQIHFEIALAAPTGKAAANLKKSIEASLNGNPLSDRLIARTLHSLLKIQKREETILSADLVLVDECSMIDTNIMAALLKAVKPGARLILLGDKYQLPSVDIGSVFCNMVDFIQNSKEHRHKCVELKKCMRTELQGIVEFSQNIKEGKIDLGQKFEGIARLPAGEFLSHPKKLVEWIAPQFKTSNFSQFRVLTPMRRGPWGIDALNKQIYQLLMKRHASNTPMEVPIMIIKNDEEMGLFNGDMGVLQTSNDVLEGRFDEHDMAIIEGKEIPALLLPKFELAYCISIHKSQGSEFPKIVLVLPEGSEVFGREVFYTAITRARRSIDLIASDATLQATLARPSIRLSGLPKRLCSA